MELVLVNLRHSARRKILNTTSTQIVRGRQYQVTATRKGVCPNRFSLKKVGTDEEFQVFECPDPLSGRDSDSDYSDSESESEPELTVDLFVGDPIVFFTAFF